MRALVAAVLILFSLAAVTPAIAQEACSCKGCGCKGGPGWRGPEGFCVSQAKLAEVCGSPPGTPCKQEAAARVCFGKQSALTGPTANTEPR
jgi:hypothetical protein